MDAKTRSLNFQSHQKNIKSIEFGLELIQQKIRESYIQEYLCDPTKIKQVAFIKESRLAYVRILTGLIVSWSEELLKRLIHEANAFEPLQISRFHELKDSRQKWTLILKLSFCNQFIKFDQNDPLYTRITEPENHKTIKKSIRGKYKDVFDLLSNEIFPAIDLRNKVQHGEWKIAFTPPLSIAIDQQITTAIYVQNIRTLQTKINDIKAIYQMIKDLATFTNLYSFKLNQNISPFEHFFDKNYERIEANKDNLIALNEAKYKQGIIQNYVRGIAWKAKNNNQQT
jgi:hypothetical protein